MLDARHLDRFLDQHRLAHPGFADEQDQVRTVVLDSRAERVPQHRELGLPSDQRRARAPGTGPRGAERLERAPRADEALPSLHGERAELARSR